MLKIPEGKNNYTYIVKCSDGSLYTGWTNDLVKRINSHNSGKGAKYTSSRYPVELVYYEISSAREEAMSREWHIKRLSRKSKEDMIGLNNKTIPQVYIADVSPLNDKALFDRFFLTVSESRQNKINALKRDEDRMLSLGAALVLKEALQQAGLEYNRLVFAENRYGKPIIVNVDNVFFNLSHSGSRIMCIVADRPVGCDVEQVSAVSHKLAGRFFSRDEIGILESIENDPQFTPEANERRYCDMFFRMWTLKESFLKCIGTGLSYPMSDFSVRPKAAGTEDSAPDRDNGIRQVSAQLHEKYDEERCESGESKYDEERCESGESKYDEERYVLKELIIDGDYRYSVCISNLPDTDRVDVGFIDLTLISDME